MKKALYSIILLSFLSSCYSYDSNYESSASQNRDGVFESRVYQKIDHSFFWGLQEKDPSKLIKKCINNEGKILDVKYKATFLNYFARTYSLGIYWPTSSKIEC